VDLIELAKDTDVAIMNFGLHKMWVIFLSS
jgi:hypothetical protein